MSINFKVIKKNQILAGAVTLMLVTASYLNYKYDPTKPYDIEVTGKIEENLGDAVLVDSNGNIQELNSELNDVQNYTVSIDDTTPVFQNNSDLILNEKENENYFISTRIDRVNRYAEQIESYEQILESSNASEEQKNKAFAEIERINGIRNSIMIAENLIKLKGFEDVVVLVNDNSINVIVLADDLTNVEVAQIQSIIVNEFSIEIENIHIIYYD